LRTFDTLPTTIAIKRIARRGGTVHVELELKTQAKDKTQAMVFFGAQDTLTFDQRWDKSQSVGPLVPGIQRLRIENAPGTGFCRVLVKNETGSFFSREAGSWK